MAEYKTLVGLTGSIGSGKTLISKVFKHLGISVYVSDNEAKKLYQNPEMTEQIADLFGQNVIKNNQIDKTKLADIVFNDTEQLQKLNNFVHPLVKQDFEQWVSKQRCPYVILESAILYETGWQSMFDKIISINTPMSLILQRVQLRDNCSKKQILRRIANQMPQEMKNSLSDYVIINDDVQLVLPQIKKIHQDLLMTAKSKQMFINKK